MIKLKNISFGYTSHTKRVGITRERQIAEKMRKYLLDKDILCEVEVV